MELRLCVLYMSADHLMLYLCQLLYVSVLCVWCVFMLEWIDKQITRYQIAKETELHIDMSRGRTIMVAYVTDL